MVTHSPSQKKLNLLQVFRGMAAVLIILFHLTKASHDNLKQEFFLDIFINGWSAVDFFFVLSGFIIFYAHFLDIGNPQKLKSFIIKRLIRIYPIYWIVTIITLIVLLILPSLAKPNDFNWIFLLKSFTLYPQLPEPLLDVGWSLTHELIFYMFFGLLIWNPKIFKFLILPWGMGIILRILGVRFGNNEVAFYLFRDVNLEFALGCLAAYLVVKRKLDLKISWLVLGSGLFVLFVLTRNYTLMYQNRLIFFGIPSMLIILGACKIDEREPRFDPVLTYLGDASYSIYLVHGPIVSVLTKMMAKLNLSSDIIYSTLMLVVLMTAISVGCLFHSAIEKPMLVFLRKSLLIEPNKNADK